MAMAMSRSAAMMVEIPRLVKRLPMIVIILMFHLLRFAELLLGETLTKAWRYQSFQSMVTAI
jgi:hypothetical protein